MYESSWLVKEILSSTLTSQLLESDSFCPIPAASETHFETKEKEAKWVKLAILHNKSKLIVQVTMETVLKLVTGNQKLNQS